MACIWLAGLAATGSGRAEAGFLRSAELGRSVVGSAWNGDSGQFWPGWGSDYKRQQGLAARDVPSGHNWWGRGSRRSDLAGCSCQRPDLLGL